MKIWFKSFPFSSFHRKISCPSRSFSRVPYQTQIFFPKHQVATGCIYSNHLTPIKNLKKMWSKIHPTTNPTNPTPPISTTFASDLSGTSSLEISRSTLPTSSSVASPLSVVTNGFRKWSRGQHQTPATGLEVFEPRNLPKRPDLRMVFGRLRFKQNGWWKIII